jgi:hypothetical protein
MKPNRVFTWLQSFGLDVGSPAEFVPARVFELPRPQLARFLRALFSGDGGISLGTEGVHLEFSSTSERLARDVQHLLLRFDVVAFLRRRDTVSGRLAWNLAVTSKDDIVRFAREIGFVAGSQKQRRLECALDAIDRSPQRKSHLDTLPREAWMLVDDACRARGTSANALVGHGIDRDQSVPRSLARELADRLSHEVLGAVAESDLLWDTVRDVRFAGFERVFDLTVPEFANFLADDVVVHNSTYARCGIIVNVTPLEPEWEGHVTLEFSNTTPLPAKIYANEGACQFLFLQGNEPCETSYADRAGKYMGQRGVTLPKL